MSGQDVMALVMRIRQLQDEYMAAVQACIASPNDVGLRSTRDELLADLSAIVFNNEQASELTSVSHSM